MTMSSPIAPAIVSAFAPTGTLRASINLGNPILANEDAASGKPAGVSVDLAHAFAQRLSVPIELVVFDKAAASVNAVRNDKADIGFFAIDPARSEGLRFTAPYVLIEGSYLVPSASPIQRNEEVDREGIRIAVGAGSAYDLFLTREIKEAQLVRVQGAKGVFESLRASQAEVAAGIRQVLEAEAARMTGLRLLPGRFMVIQQAMGTPTSRGAKAAAVLSAFVEEMKASGFVADALARHRIQGAIVAPPAAQA
jgi:polar amino acid transport system substrate-binding protein